MNFYEKARYKINLYRRYRYWDSAGIIFIHVPKAAGTSINRALYGRTLGHYPAMEIAKNFPQLFAKSYVFSVVRNPWDRMVSAYRFAKLGGTTAMRMKGWKRYNGSEFDTFERFLFDWLQNQDLYRLDFIFQPQVKFLYTNERPDQRLLLDYLCKLETLTEDLSHVRRETGIAIQPEVLNSTRNKLDFRAEYKNSAMVDIVAKLYSSDIKRFNYSFE